MARIFWDGAEFGDILFWDATAGAPAASTTQKRTGNYSYFIDGSSGTTAMTKNITAVAELYFRTGIYITGTGAGNLIYLRKGTTTIAELYRNSSNLLAIYVGSSLVATGSIPVKVNTWYLIEWHLKLDNSAGESTIKIDSVTDATFSGDTMPGADTTVDNIYLISSPGGGPSRYFDDMALNDTSGSTDKTWCGDGRIELLNPNGNGAANQWTGSDSDTTDNYLLVDDIPASATDYVEDSTAGHQDMYELSDFDGTGKRVQRVRAEARAMNTTAEGATLKLGARVNGSNYLSDAINLLTSYTRVVGTDYTLNPDDSAVWEEADLDGSQFIAETV